ncbi:PREDICTED: heparan-sulfate 6-O-sulfotransferase 2 isoform X2 [Ceratosolen solmsi marchali]|uniref:Heparan-sulfate 6-O-sulfotransferase n=1 Tax=Ceratosolen solmsi marchali TaxID=326594 RepID=A0AAJ7DW91_9HYME|nr:PREDICTED: heparan-sulfate 6-O-sulfotransferase 2 isoform X2 [Ceratosolen solmsi marchali]
MMSKRVPEKDGTTRAAARTSHSDLAPLLAPDVPSPSCAMTDSRSARRSSLRNIVGICLLLALAGMLYLGYFCPDHVCALSTRDSKESTRFSESLLSIHPAFKLQSIQGSLGYDDIFLNDTFQFDINAHDVMVFLHIQKTGGTLFGKHLVRDLDLQKPCSCQRRRKRCFCFRPNRSENWLFSRYSTGWKCGLHADWTELTGCVDSELNKIEGDNVKRRYFYITIIRNPVARYLSEFRHVQRGATWRGARHWCGGAPTNIPQCYSGPNWKGVTLEQFMACPYNLASNRQTRMLADLSLVGCYNSSLSSIDRDQLMLASAKHNLKYMPFFMLTEYQKVGQYSFEETFGMRFAVAFEQHNATLSAATMATLTPEQLDAIRRLNKLDLELYEYATNLAFQRFRRLRDRDPYFVQRFQHLGELPSRQSVTEFNWDSVIEDTTDID